MKTYEIVMFARNGRAYTQERYIELLKLLGYKVVIIKKGDICE